MANELSNYNVCGGSLRNANISMLHFISSRWICTSFATIIFFISGNYFFFHFRQLLQRSSLKHLLVGERKVRNILIIICRLVMNPHTKFSSTNSVRDETYNNRSEYLESTCTTWWEFKAAVDQKWPYLVVTLFRLWWQEIKKLMVNNDNFYFHGWSKL